MQFINYFFASLISFLGLAIGILLIEIAPEEQKPLEKNFSLLRKNFLFLIFIFLIIYYFKSLFYSLAIVFFALFIFFVESKNDNLLRKSMLSYPVLGILFFLSLDNSNLFTIESSLILLHGIPTASLLYKKKEKNYYKVLFYNFGFILIANLLFFITTISHPLF